jgi:hypothetical protein
MKTRVYGDDRRVWLAASYVEIGGGAAEDRIPTALMRNAPGKQER